MRSSGLRSRERPYSNNLWSIACKKKHRAAKYWHGFGWFDALSKLPHAPDFIGRGNTMSSFARMLTRGWQCGIQT
jgi:hypothetical protein